MLLFPKPDRKVKEKKSYNSLQSGKRKEKKPVSELKQIALANHKDRPNKADRAEFPPSVVKAAIERSGSICEYCRKQPCSSTHHVVSRNRGGRGVLPNSFRACGTCHIEIEGSEEKKQKLITLYTGRYGERFWFDEQDWQEYDRKQVTERMEEQEKQMRSERLAPVLSILTELSGRSLRKKELRLIEAMNERELEILVGLTSDMAKTLLPGQSFGYGHFED